MFFYHIWPSVIKSFSVTFIIALFFMVHTNLASQFLSNQYLFSFLRFFVDLDGRHDFTCYFGAFWLIYNGSYRTCYVRVSIFYYSIIFLLDILTVPTVLHFSPLLFTFDKHSCYLNARLDNMPFILLRCCVQKCMQHTCTCIYYNCTPQI